MSQDLTPNNRKLISALLELASDQFSNHGCNDFDLAAILPNVEDRRELMRKYHEHNGDPEEFDPEWDYEYVQDDALMGYFSVMLAEED